MFGLNEEQRRSLRANQLEYNKRHMKVVEKMELLMNLPTPEDLAEAKAVGHYVEYILAKKNAKPWEVYSAVMKMNDIGVKFLDNKWPQDALDGYIDLNSMKEIVARLMQNLIEGVKELEKKGKEDASL